MLFLQAQKCCSYKHQNAVPVSTEYTKHCIQFICATQSTIQIIFPEAPAILFLQGIGILLMMATLFLEAPQFRSFTHRHSHTRRTANLLLKYHYNNIF